MALLVGTVGGCGGGGGWPKTAGDTTCTEWTDQMTADQRRGISEAILKSLWDENGGAETPPDVLSFANDIGTACASATLRDAKVSLVAQYVFETIDTFNP